jgi:hypothetical protein
MINDNSLTNLLEQQIRESVDRSMQHYVDQVIQELQLDPEWINKIESLINQNFLRKFDEAISLVDVDTLISRNIDSGITRWQDRLTDKFCIRGITDHTTKPQIMINDLGISVINDIESDNLLTRKDSQVKGTLTVNNLAVLGDINVDNRSWDTLATAIAEKTLDSIGADWGEKIKQQVLESAKTSGIDFESIKLGGQFLVNDGRLCDSVTKSNICELAALESLTVKGSSNLGDTVRVSGRRVGVNTEQPDMALSIWDEEVTMSVGKIAAKKGFVGTSRLQNLQIGVNRTGYIEIDTEGLVTVNKLRIGQHRISHADQVPGYAGTKGDIVFNSDPRESAPFAWVCLGNYRWHPLKSA